MTWSSLRRRVLLLGLAALVSQPAAAQDVTFRGQVRPRTEVRDQDGAGDAVSFTSMRVRLGIAAQLQDAVSTYVELQDVRVFGEETSTLGDFDADHLDLHQGWVQAALGEDRWMSIRVGRQETNLGGQRLVGAVGWTQQGRSFDGIRLSAARPRLHLDFLAYRTAESDGTNRSVDGDLLGAYATVDLHTSHNVDLFSLLNRQSGIDRTRQVTSGVRFHGDYRSFRYRAEAALQRGKRAGDDVSAYMVGLRIGRTLSEGRTALTLWYDYLSGDADLGDTRTKVFDTLFATNHKFYGLADLFLNVPVHTGGRGLSDAAVKVTQRVGDRVRANLDLHAFRASEDAGLTTADLAQEVDFTLAYSYTDDMTLTGGASHVFASDGIAELGRLTGDLTFAYLMVDVRF